MGKYMIRPVFPLERLTFLESEGKVGYRSGEKGAAPETVDYLEFIARVTSHIPDKGQVMAPAVFQECLWAADPPAKYFP